MKRNKVSWICMALVLLVGWMTATAQPSKTAFEAERKVLLQRIKSIQKILTKTVTQKKVSMGRLNALNRQIESNSLLIQSLNQEIESINRDIQQKKGIIVTLKQDLEQLKKEYATMLYVGAKALPDIHQLMFIFSASSFHKLVQRLRYVKQYAQIRHKHFLEIEKVVAALHTQQAAARQRKQEKSRLLHSRQYEKAKLTDLKGQQAQMVDALEQQHTQLTKELEQRNRAVKRLDKLITDIIQQELLAKKKAASEPTRPSLPISEKRLTALFRKSRGKLPWPVKTGFISGKFGIGPHPVLRNVQVENLGIDIQTQEGAKAYAVFQGIVKTIAFVPGMHHVVIIQHGAYHSVYAKLKHTTVKVGEYVQAESPIGTIYTDAQGVTELQLQLWEATQKLNPAWWLKKGSTP